MSYNGWSNYETWNVALWIDNEEGSYNERMDATSRAWENTNAEDKPEERSLDARIELAEVLEDWVSEMEPNLGASMWADLLGKAVAQVDWHEIADNFLSDTEGYVSREKAA